MAYELIAYGIACALLTLFLFFAKRYPLLINSNLARALLKACGVYESAIVSLGAIDTATTNV